MLHRERHRDPSSHLKTQNGETAKLTADSLGLLDMHATASTTFPQRNERTVMWEVGCTVVNVILG